MRSAEQKKRLVALVLGAALVVALGAFAIAGDIGEPSLADDEVAVVEGAPDPAITDEELQTNLEQAAFNLNLREIPPPEDPQFEQVQQAAISNAIQGRWVGGEAAERGITVTDRDVDQALDSIINDQLGGKQGYEKFLDESPFDEEAVRAVAELTALSERLQADAISPEPPTVSDAEVQEFYDANLVQFETPETRDVRVILNPDEAEIEQAQALLDQDDSPSGWEKAAKQYSTDEATRNDGGLRENVSQGQNEPALDDAIFSAAPGSPVGPITGESGSYLIQVEKVNPGQTAPLDDVSDQIRQTLQQGIQAQDVEQFRSDFIAKWTSRTFCQEEIAVALCANAPPAADPCPIDDEAEREQADPAILDAGCPAPALPRNVVNPGTGAVFPGEQLPVLPQGPLKPIQPPAAGLPPGAAPLGPGGAPPAGAQGAPPAGAQSAPPAAAP
ncbi:MAG: peptidyl-prolyl cis-trans isomerase [bacterium]